MKKFSVLLAISTLILSACSTAKLSPSEQETCLSNHSKAFCTLDLVGLSKGAKDITAELAKKTLEEKGLKYSDSTAFNQSSLFVPFNVAIGADTLYKASNLGFGAALPSALFMFAMASDNRPNGQRPQFFIVLPESEVKNGNPMETVRNALFEGMKKTMNADKIVPSKTGYTINWNMYGGKCGESGCKANTVFFNFSESKSEIFDGKYNKYAKPFVIEKSPVWMGSEKLYVWTGNGLPSVSQNIKEMNKGENYVTIRHYPELFKNLPSWFYFYQPGDFPTLITNKGFSLLAH